MAVLRQDLLRSTFQEKQIKLLESLDDNMSISTRSITRASKVITDDLLGDLDKMFETLADSINKGLAYASGVDVTKRREEEKERERSSQKSHKDSEDAEESRYKRSASLWTKLFGDQKKSLDRIFSSISTFNRNIGFTLDSVVANTDQFSAFYNTTIKNTGMSGTAAQEFRGDILDIVKELNQQYRNQYGGAFNANESLQVLATVVNSGIRNPEYYAEFGDELLEANAAMNINLATLAKFSDKFYRRYNFSSESMETLLNNINTNVATTNVSEEDLIRQIEENEFVVAKWLTYNEGLVAGSQEFERRQSEINTSLNDALAYATEVGLENTLSMILSAIDGGQTSSEARMILNATGMSVEDLERGYMTDATELLYSIAEKIEGNGVVQSYLSGPYRKEWANATGFDETVMKEVFKATEMSPEEFAELKAQRATAKSLEEKVDDIYVSTEDRFANNLLDKYGDSLANMQEDTGLSLTFLESIANTALGILGLLVTYTGSKTLSSLLTSESGLMGSIGKLFGGSTSAGSGGLLSHSSKLGVAAIIAAAVLATVKAVNDVTKTLEDIKTQTTQDEAELLPDSISGKHYALEAYTDIDEDGNLVTRKKLVELDDSVGPLSEEDIREQLRASISESLYNNYYGKKLLSAEAYESGAATSPIDPSNPLYHDEALTGYVPRLYEIGERAGIVPDYGWDLYYGPDEEGYDDVWRLTVENYVGEHLDELTEAYLSGDKKVSPEGLFSKTFLSGTGNNRIANSAYQSVLGIESLESISSEAALLYDAYHAAGILGKGFTMDDLISRFIPNQDKLLKLTEMGYFVGSNAFSSDYISELSVDELISKGIAREIESLDVESKAYEALAPLRTSTSLESEGEGPEAYASGTNYVPYDQLAYIHEGEAITPKKYNPAANVNELERLRSQEAEVQESTLTSMKEVVSTVKAIKDFLEYWRQDNIDRDALASVKDRTLPISSNLTSLMSGYASY